MQTRLYEFVTASLQLYDPGLLLEEGVQLTRLLRRAIDSSLLNAPQIDCDVAASPTLQR